MCTDDQGRVQSGQGGNRQWFLAFGNGVEVWVSQLLVTASVQPDMDSERLKPSAECSMMLRGQDFGRRHQRDIVASFQNDQCARRSHSRLPRPNVTLQQPPHGLLAPQVVPDLAQYFGLGLRQTER